MLSTKSNVMNDGMALDLSSVLLTSSTSAPAKPKEKPAKTKPHTPKPKEKPLPFKKPETVPERRDQPIIEPDHYPGC